MGYSITQMEASVYMARCILSICLVFPGVAAHAQFSVVSQSGSVFASATGGINQSQTSVPGDFASFKLGVETGDPKRSFSSASSGTVIEAGKVGISAGTGATVYPYPIGFGPAYESAYAAASVTLTFDVLKSTDVMLDVIDYYRPDRLAGYVQGFSSDLKLSKQDTNGKWVMHVGREALGILTHLDEGRYQLSTAFSYRLDRPSDLAGGGASVSITAVPEPATYALMGLGLLGVGLARHSKRAQAV